MTWSARVPSLQVTFNSCENSAPIGHALQHDPGWGSVFGPLSRALSETSLMLLLAGGVAYSVGAMFHLFARVRAQPNAGGHP
jgi:hypothetical protein